jgi:hypothetical protein
MKKLITICSAILMTASVFAQAPNKMSYQAVIRNNSNTLVANQAVGMRISILQGSPSGTAAYVETHTPTTNANGLASIEIGGGTVVSGNFSTINWANGSYFVKTETDPSGGNSYSINGTSQLLSVPYALYSENSGNNYWSLSGDSLTFSNGNVGINENSPESWLHVTSTSSKTGLLVENTSNNTSAKVVLAQTGSPNGNTYYLVSRSDGNFVIGNATVSIIDQFVLDSIGQVGIKIIPERTFHVKDVMRIEPTNSAPLNPSEGDIYMNALTHKLMVFDGTTWRSCW